MCKYDQTYVVVAPQFDLFSLVFLECSETLIKKGQTYVVVAPQFDFFISVFRMLRNASA